MEIIFYSRKIVTLLQKRKDSKIVRLLISGNWNFLIPKQKNTSTTEIEIEVTGMEKSSTYISIELTNETGEIVVLEINGKNTL